jgi:hypothetical protein
LGCGFWCWMAPPAPPSILASCYWCFD